MVKKAFGTALTVIAVAWMCLVSYNYFLAHPEQLTLIRKFNANLQFLAGCVGIYSIVALFQRYSRGLKTWNFVITPIGIWGAFGVVVLAWSGFLHKSGPWSDSDLFTAEFNVIGWFLLISAALFLLTTFFHVIGDGVLGKFEFRSPLDKFVFTIGAGMMTTVAAMFVLSQAHLLYSLVAWSGVLGVLAWRHKLAVSFWRQMIAHKIPVRTKVFSPVNFLFLFLISVVAANFFTLVRPIPYGFDDMTLYLNFPKLSAHYHYLLNGGGYNFTPMVTLSFLLFDNDTLAMFFPFFCGLCGVLATLALARRFFSMEIGVFSATVFYLTPMVMWQSSIDFKSDQTLFYFITLAIYSMFEWFTQIVSKVPTDDRTADKSGLKWLALAGILAGFCIGVKLTAILMIFAMVVFIALVYLGRSGALSAFFLLFFIAWKSNQVRLAGGLTEGQLIILTNAGLILALAFGLVALVRHRTSLIRFGLRIGLFAGLAALTLAPWLLSNAIAKKDLSLSGLFASRSGFVLDLKRINADFSSCGFTGESEERGRFLGFNKGFDEILSLPWKVTLNTAANTRITDVGVVFLALLPAFLGMGIWYRGENLSSGIAALSWFLFWVIWVMRITLNPTGDLNSPIFTTNLIFDYGLMLVLMATACFYAVWRVRNPLLTAIVLLAAVSWFFWTLVGSGIIWYGLVGFLPLTLLVGYLVFTSPPFLRATGWLLIFIALASQVTMRDELSNPAAAASYAYGLMDYTQSVETLLTKDFLSMADVINKNTGTASENNYVYRIGTLMPYFIQENDRRVFSDDKLDFFNCLNLGQSDEETYRRLKGLGFRHMVVSLVIMDIEKDPNGSLHQKGNRFLGWVNRMVQGGRIKSIINHERTIALLEFI